MKTKILSMTLLLSVCATGYAGFSAVGSDTRQILAEQTRILREIDRPTGEYSRFSVQAQRELKAAQARIFNLLGDGRVLEELSKDEQVELLNSVEQIKAILSSNERDKLQCWREPKLGSHLRVTRCETVAVRERLREESRGWKSDTGACQMGANGAPVCGPSDN